MNADYLREQPDGILLAVKVLPRASRTALAEPLGGELKIKVAAPPVDDAANEELVRFIAERLACPRGAVRIVRGRTSRHKVIAVRGLTLAQARAGLQQRA